MGKNLQLVRDALSRVYDEWDWAAITSFKRDPDWFLAQTGRLLLFLWICYTFAIAGWYFVMDYRYRKGYTRPLVVNRLMVGGLGGTGARRLFGFGRAWGFGSPGPLSKDVDALLSTVGGFRVSSKRD